MTRYAAFPTASLYTLIKDAITGFNRRLMRDLGPKGITVNTVHPGPTDTDMNPDGGPVSQIVGPRMAVGRYGKPHEIANIVAFLAGPEAGSSLAPTSLPTAVSPPDQRRPSPERNSIMKTIGIIGSGRSARPSPRRWPVRASPP